MRPVGLRLRNPTAKGGVHRPTVCKFFPFLSREFQPSFAKLVFSTYSRSKLVKVCASFEFLLEPPKKQHPAIALSKFSCVQDPPPPNHPFPSFIGERNLLWWLTVEIVLGDATGERTLGVRQRLFGDAHGQCACCARTVSGSFVRVKGVSLRVSLSFEERTDGMRSLIHAATASATGRNEHGLMRAIFASNSSAAASRSKWFCKSSHHAARVPK